VQHLHRAWCIYSCIVVVGETNGVVLWLCVESGDFRLVSLKKKTVFLLLSPLREKKE
jgi:hypothetical protein